MAKKTKPVVKSDDKILFAFLATFLSIVGFILAIVTKREDRYVMFYAKQSLVVFIVAILGAVVNSILWIIPILGWAIATVVNLCVIALWVFSWIYALSDKPKEVPIVGNFARHFNF